jgi:hypothetical protein
MELKAFGVLLKEALEEYVFDLESDLYNIIKIYIKYLRGV